MNVTVRSVLWSAIERFSVQIVQFVLTIILSRLISPSDYGLIAMLSIFMQIAQSFVDSGFSNALIQKKDRTETDYTTVFVFNILISVAAYLLLFISAPYIAAFYNEPLLTSICRVIGLNIIIQGLSVVQIAKLTIELNFKRQASASLISIVVSGIIGVYCAYKGFGVWALVVQTVLNSLLNTSLLFIITKWRPVESFSWKSLSSLFSFGSKLLVSGLLHTIYVNLYSLVIGKRYSSSDVGYYNQSNQIARFPSVSLMAIITRALYPIQCRNQNDDKVLKDTFLQYLSMSSFIVFAIMIYIASNAEPLVIILLTDKWAPIIPILRVLSIGYVFTSITVLNNQILNVKGRSDLYLKVEVLKKILGIIILIATLPFGVLVMSIGILVYNICDMLLVMTFAKKVIPINIKQQLITILPIFLIIFITGCLTFFAISFAESAVFKLIIGTITYAVSIYTFSHVFQIKECGYIINLAKSVLHK